MKKVKLESGESAARKYQFHNDGRPLLREFGGNRKLFFRSLREWCIAEGVCPKCRNNRASRKTLCEPCLTIARGKWSITRPTTTMCKSCLFFRETVLKVDAKTFAILGERGEITDASSPK